MKYTGTYKLLSAGLLTILIFSSCGGGQLSGRVEGFFHLYTDPAAGEIEHTAELFSENHPQVEITVRTLPYQDMRRELLQYLKAAANREESLADQSAVAVLTGGDLTAEEIRPYVRASDPWIRTGWKLYYNKERLEALGWTEEELSELTSRGMDEFITQMQNSIQGPESVFLLGAAYYWPWLAWIQHLYAGENNGRMPEDYQIETWNEAIGRWNELLSREGVFNEDYRELNYAGSTLGIRDGDGLFVLSDSTIFQVYTPEERPGLGSISFPGARSWEIGTGFYTAVLARDNSGSSLKAASAYRAFLHSPGVREEMLATSGILLLPLSRERDTPAKREIPSITQNIRDPEIEELLKYLDK